ncbi:putative GAF sensor protein [Arthrobacter sp. FB24]|uniref:GAF and ANTAR domain-containing protein n=1 Tax=Arthrobacter sp. (strain FB24) TaxID=290399 RepID=UPI0000527D87|nr:GAF and ANTAR domain-containing protein [Arthrobacter sp. FB24]ABK04549.1 putative GAF sensor protein [Arthrobacter sp. FB24]
MPQELPLDEITLTFARIKGLLLTRGKVDRAVQLLAEGIRDAFPGCSGVGVSLVDEDGGLSSAGSTDTVVINADAAQYELGQGPCLRAWESQRTVLVNDAGSDERWPLWSRAARDLSIKSVVSSPLVVASRCLGALKVYSSLPGAFDNAAALSLEKFAVPAATLLDHIQGPDTPRRFTEVVTAALHSRDTTHRAQGILMQRHGFTPERALEELMHLSRTSKQSLASVSAEILKISARQGPAGPYWR